MAASQLTPDVLKLILQHLSQPDRLARCALVCKQWQRAAVECSRSVWVRHSQDRQQEEDVVATGFQHYLQLYGSHVTQLAVSWYSNPLELVLPCRNLRDLEVCGMECQLQLGPSSSQPGVLASCTGLTRLDLENCSLVGAGPASDGGDAEPLLSALSLVPSLRDLRVWMHEAVLDVSRVVVVPGGVFASLKQLTSLVLTDVRCDDIHHVSCLTNLCVFELSPCPDLSPVCRLAPDIAPAGSFMLPASLRSFESGYGLSLDPAVLSTALQLTRLHLDSAVIEGHGSGMCSGSSLLAAVAKFQQLVVLEATPMVEVEWPPQAAEYAGLTASTSLRELIVCADYGVDNAWRAFFPPGRILSSLQCFKDHGGYVWCAEAVSSFVRAAPACQHLVLTHLSLYVDGLQGAGDADADAAASVQAVAALTGLRSLGFGLDAGLGANSITTEMLRPLTALTG